MAFALYHGALTFFVTMLSLQNTFHSTGHTASHWITSTVAFTICLLLATIKLFLESNFLNVINFSAGIASLFLYYIVVFFFSLEVFAEAFQYELEAVINDMFASVKCWML